MTVTISCLHNQTVMLKKTFSKYNLPIFLILLVAAFMRLYRIGDYLTFLGDEGRDVLVVYNILHGHLTLLGPTASVGGFFLGPIYYYFMAPFLWLFQYNPVGPAVMIALAGIVTVWFVYVVGTQFFDRTTGIIAALLMAISPLVLVYSRSSWNPNLMPLTTLLLLFVLYKAVKKNSSKFYLLAGVLLGIALQLHYIEVFVGATIVLYVFVVGVYKVLQKKFSLFTLLTQYLKAYAALLVGFLVGWSPFLAFEFRHGFHNIQAIINFIFHPATTGNGVGVAKDTWWIMQDIFYRVFGRLVLNVPSPDLYSRFPQWQLHVWFVTSWIIGLGSVSFLVWQLVKHVKDTDKFYQYTLLLFWLILGVLFFGFYKKNIYDYYFEFLFPAPFLFVGAFASFFLHKANWVKVITLVILAGIVLLNLQGIPFRYEPNRQLLQTETISKFVLDQTGGKPFNFALITGGNSDYAYRYFFTVWGHPPVTIQNAQVDPSRSTVTSQLLVVCESLPCQPLGNSLWEIAGFGRAQVSGHWPVSVVEVYKLTHYKAQK